ncbi:tyrosinase cofactor [Streptomyces sp. NPDC006879]|uniref:apotyrosinase chaperone MelC1 n=1 Tax=Streptomyces sp. NPDC006879 TaxID=3364767 RepID=UPI00368526BC
MSQITRRRALGGTAAAVAALAVAFPAYATSVAGSPGGHDGHDGHADMGSDPSMPASFDEVYQGRRIQGGPAQHGGGHHAAMGHEGHAGGYRVLIDGKELHIMQNADGTWISVVNHYETYANPRAVARAAVVELQGATLVPLA